MQMVEKIMEFRGAYHFLSNMYSAPFEWDGRRYKNSEAAFQSAKTMNPQERDAFSEMNGVVAKRAGKKVLLRGDWEDVKDGVMEEVVRAKFSQNPELLEKLLATGDAELVEGNRWHDQYWGFDLLKGVGENHLGMILMRIRAELGGAEYLDRTTVMKAEKENAAREKKERIIAEIRDVKEQIAAIPEYDFTGMTFATKAFGKVVIKRHKDDYLYFDVQGKEKIFSLPGCIVQGFLLPENAEITENFNRILTLKEKLKALLKEAATEGVDLEGLG